MNREERMNLERMLIEDKNRFGLLATSIKILNLKPKSGHISESISPTDWTITVNIDPEWEPEKDEILIKYVKSKGYDENIVYLVARDLVNHAAGHWEYPYRSGRGCPYDIEHHEIILDATTKALKELGKIDIVEHSKNEKRRYIDPKVAYLANAFEDLCLNANIAFVNGKYPGCIISFYDQGLNNGKFPPFYEAFVKLNMELFGTEEEKELLSKFYGKSDSLRELNTNPNEVDNVVKNVISELGLKNKLENNVRILFNKDMWHGMAYRFAYNMGKLLGDVLEEEVVFSENPFNKKIEHPTEVGRILIGRHKAGSGAPAYLHPVDALDLYYQRLAAEIPVLAETSRKSISFPVVHYGYEPFDKDKHNPEDINIKKLCIDDKAKINFQVSRYSLDMQIPIKERVRGFPNIVYIIDTSSSMLEPIDSDPGRQVFEAPWKDRSKYHYVLLGLYGSLKYIETRNISPYIQYEIFNFSGETISLGRSVSSSELIKLRKLALSPQLDGTELDVAKLKSELYKQHSVVLMLSDGEIHNWENVKNDFRKLIEPHMFSFIRIGYSTEIDKDIKNWGKPVYKVEKSIDIPKLMIDLTKQSYKPWVR